MSVKSALWLFFVTLLASCTPVPDAEVSTAVPARSPAPSPAVTAVFTAAPLPLPTAIPPTQTSHDEAYGLAATAPSAPAITLGQPEWLGRGLIQDAVFLPGARQVAIGWANALSLVDVADGAEGWQHTTDAVLLAVTAHPQGTAVAAALGDGTLLVVEVATGQAQLLAAARPHAYWGDIAWSPDGRTIAFQFIGPNRGDPIYLLNVADGLVTEVPGTRLDAGTRPYLVWSPDSQTLTLPALGETCGRLVNVTTGATFLPLAHEAGCYDPYAVAWLPQGSVLALSRAGHIDILDAVTFAVAHQLESNPLPFGAVQTGDPLAFSEGGDYLFSKGGSDFYNTFYPFQVWDMATGESVKTPAEDATVIDGVGDGSHRMAVAFNGETFLSLRRDGRLTSWRPPAAAEAIEETVVRLPVIAPQGSFVWSDDGRKIAATSRYGGTAVWDVATNKMEAFFEVGRGAPALGANGRLLALLDGENGEIAVYDLETQQLLSRLPGATSLPGGAFSFAGSLLAYGAGNQVVLADPLTGAVVATLAGHPAASTIGRVIWSPDASALVTAAARDEQGELILWQQAPAGAYQEVFRSQTVRAGYCCGQLALFNPGGTLVALENLVRPEAGQFKIAVYDRQTGSVNRWLAAYRLAAWVSDDVLLTAEAQYDTRLTQWHVRTGEKTVGQATDTGGQVYAPNGLFFARQNVGGGNIGRGIDVHFWRSHQLVARVAHGNDILQISWSPDGRYLASLAIDGTIRVWPVSYP